MEWHFRGEPGLEAVFVLRMVEGETIKLLEVNTATVATGSIESFAFGATKDTPYPMIVAEVTPAKRWPASLGALKGLPKWLSTRLPEA